MNSRIETARLSENHYKEDLSNLLLKASDLAGKRVLDIGSGYGGLGDYLRFLNLDCEVVNLDKRRFATFLDSQSVTGTAYRLPFQNNVFDVVVSSGCIPILCVNKLTTQDQVKRNARQALKEAFRVTKPGGKIRMHFVPTVDSIKSVGLYDWEHYGQMAVSEATIGYVNLLNSKGHIAKVLENTLVIAKSQY